MLEGKLVNLRVIEKEDIDFQFACVNQIDFWGEYGHPPYEQAPKWYLMEIIDNPNDFQKAIDFKWFVIEKKDRTKIGLICRYTNQPYGTMEIGCFLVPDERGKGYGTEATQLMVDYLFLSRDIVRIDIITNVRNKPAQNALKKAGFQIEGTIRKHQRVRGEWNDFYLLSILREEWKEPKILMKTV